MSATGLEVFDKTLQLTHIWLNDICEATGPDRQLAWKTLTAVLHTLRNRLPVELSSHLGAQLPLLVRGAYYDQYEPSRQPTDCRSYEEFRDAVAKRMSEVREIDTDAAIRAVFAVLSRHLTEGQALKVWQAMPEPVRDVWTEAERSREGADVNA